MDFKPEDSITYKTFERAFDTHPEECSSSTVCTVEECSSSAVCTVEECSSSAVVVGTDDNDCHIVTTESDHNMVPEIDKIDDLEVGDIGEEKGGAEERIEVKVEDEEEEVEEEDESKTDEEREEEKNKEERKKVVAESMILYTAQLRSQKEKEHDKDNAIEKEKGEVRSVFRIEARTEVEDDRDKDDNVETKVEKEGALCNSMSCMLRIKPLLMPCLHDITSSMYRVSSCLIYRPTFIS